jgi:multiple sugar transport system substrate-binding protein
MSAKLSRRKFLRRIGAAGAGLTAALAGCQPKTVIVEREVPVTQIVEVEKEVTKIVAGTPVVEKVVETQVVEKVVKETVVVEKVVAPEEASGQIRVSMFSDATVNRVVDLMIAGFNGRHPKVEVKIDFQVGDYTERVYAQAAAGNLADVVWTGDSLTLPYVANGVMTDLRPFAEGDPEFDLDDVVDVMIGLTEPEGYPGIWWLPSSLDVVTMYYNKTAFENVGIAPPTEDWTWDDYIDAGKALTEEKDEMGNPKVWIGDNGYNWWAWVWPWLVGYGGDVMNPEGTQSTWSTPEGLEAMAKYTSLWTEHEVRQPLGVDVGGDAFTLGRAATFAHIAGLRKHFQETIQDKFEWDVQLVPMTPDGKHRTGMGAYGFGIFSGSDQKDLAWDFVKYLNMPTMQLIMAKQMLGMPLLKSLAGDPRWLDALSAPPTNHMAFINQAEDAVLPRTHPMECGGPYVGVVNQAFTSALEAAIRGQKDVQTAFTECDEQIQACMDEHI